MDTSNASSAKSKTSASASSSSINGLGLGPQNKHILSQDISSVNVNVAAQDDKNETPLAAAAATVLTVVGQSMAKSTTPLAVLHLPPPTATALVQASANISELGSMPRARPSFVSNTSSTEGKPMAVTSMPPESASSSEPSCPVAVSMASSACDFDSDTELSIVAAAAAVSAAAGIDSRSPTSPPPSAPSTIMPALGSGGGGTAASLSTMAGSQGGFGAGSGVVAGNTNGHSTSSSSTHLSLNAKQQRQQKRRRERAQRLQAERDSRCNSSSLSGTFIAGSVGVSAISAANVNAAGGQGSLVTPNGGNSSVAIGNGSAAGPGNGMIYHINSAGSMGEDSNNSNGNFTSSSNGSNNLLPPTDSIASLLLNPPHSPECNSGLMATPSDSEGESLDEDLLSTSSSSTLLLPRDKPPPRPPPPVRRKLPRSPVLEEEIIDGFAILEFKTYEDLEFAIKLGQKRKEKRLSALDELTCTYSIEEMKIPKVIDTGQSQPLRVTSLSTLTVNNNNLKENPHPHPHPHPHPQPLHRGGNVISNNNISSNGPSANSNNNSSLTNVVYLLPSVNIGTVLETETEPRDHWRSEYGQQQDQLQSDNSANSKSNIISDDNQINNSSHQINHSNQSNKQAEGGCNAAKMQVNSATSTRFLENDNDSLMLDISQPSLGVGGAVSHSHDHIDVGMIHASCTGGDTKKSHNSPATSNTIDQLHVTKSLPSLQLNNLISSDLTATANASNNHLGVCKLGSQSAQVVKKSNGLENIETVTTSATCRSLEIQELPNVPAQAFGASSSIKKENEQSDLLNDASINCSSTSKGNNICDNVSNDKKNSEQMFDIDNTPTPMNVSNTSLCQDRSTSRKLSDLPHLKKKSAACGDNSTFSGVPFTSSLSSVSVGNPESDASKALNIKNTSESTQGKVVHAGVSVPTSPANVGESGNRELGMLQKSSSDKALYPSMCVTPSVSSVQFPNVGISAGNEKIVSTVASDIDQKIIFNTKTTVSNGLSSGVQRSIVPLLSAAQSPATATISSPFSAHIATPNAGLSILSSASSVILASSIKSNDNFARSNNNSSNNNNGSSISQGTLSSVGLSTSSEITKNSSVSTSSPPNPIVNGFLSVYPPATIATSSVTTSTLPRVSPNATNKLVAPVSTSISINTNYVGISGGTTTTSGMGKVVFGTGGNAIVGTGSPLLFPGAPPAPISHVASGVPMIIQAPPYRAPYTNYPLYTPYSGLTHGSYLPPVLPVATSNIPPTQIRSSDSRNSRESPASLKATSSNIALNVSMTPTLRSITPLNNTCAISSGASQPVVSVVPSANSTALSLSNSHISHSHHVPVYATGAFSSAAAGTSTPNSGLSTLAVTSLSTSAAPQPHFPQSTQMHSQSGNFSSVSHLLTTHSMPPQNQPLVRCGSALYSSSASAVAAASNFSPSVLAVQSLTTAVTSSSSSPSTSSSSVIQKVISPKGESPCNKDRDPSYSTNIRSHGASTILPVVSQGISLGSSFCGIPPSQYGGTGTSVLSSSSSMTGLGNLPSYSSKAALWLNSPANPVVTSCASSTPIVSSGSARPTPPLSNCTSMGIGMVNSAPTARSSCNAISPLSIPATAGIHVSATNPSFQSSSYFPTPLAPPPSSPSPATSSATIISSASPFPAVSHSMSSIVTTAGAATTSASSITQPTAPAISNTVTSTPHPFSAESLFQPSKNDQADLLRRELDSRFLDRSGLAVTPTPPSSTYLRTDLQHQQHAHLHQHPQLLPPASASSTPLTAVQPTSGQIFPPPLFKDLSKISSVDPQFYRAGMGLPTGGYSGYTSAGLLHSGLGGPTPFMPPNHLTSFAPKKTGRWNAMHVRIAWEIYYHQNKQSSEKTGFPTASSNAQSINAPIPPGNLISGGGGMASGANTPVNNVAAIPAVGGGVLVSNGPASVLGIKTTPQLGINTAPQHILHRANELPPSAAFANALPGRLAFDSPNLTASFIGAPPSHIGTAVSPFGRYVNPFGFTGITHFSGHLDSWRTNAMQRTVAAYHPSTASASPNWPVKSDPGLDNARREAEERERELRDREQRERDRQRREREERERKEKEEKLKREQQERERERERDRKERERERREIERREMERERMLQQQRINESNKQAAAVHAAAAVAAPVRDRSPHRNVGELNTEIRIKEEHPRTKDEQDVMLLRASAAAVGVGDPRYHSSSLAAAQANAAAAAAHHHHANFMAASRHGLPPPSHLTRTMMPPTLSVGGPMTHFGAPAPPGWGIDPYRDPYPMLRYNPIMEAALRHEAEERQKAINIYAAQSAAHLRSKEPSPIPPSVGSLGPPPPHHRLQIVTGGVVGSSGVQQQQPGQQQPQLSSGGGIGKNSGPPAPVSIPVQHMISVDSMSQQTVTAKKEADHTMGIVTNAGVGLSSVPGGVIGISPVSSVAPSR